MRNLIIILDRNAVAFCHYVNPNFGKARPDWMGMDVLKGAINHAQQNGLALIYLVGRHSLPSAHAKAIGQTSHTIMAPFSRQRRMKGMTAVMEMTDVSAVKKLRDGSLENAILRLDRSDMPSLGADFGSLCRKVKRLNICLLDLDQYQQQDMDMYREQLIALVDAVTELEWPAQGNECNVLTDRLMLRAMNNCDAGIKHLTVAPNGNFYLCPGFYYEDETAAVGSLKEGIQIKNERLLELESAPICRRCDAYHCRRCLLLNKKLTEEINTPSRQQCVTAHLEREASGVLLERLRQTGRLDGKVLSEIPKLEYLDPYEALIASRKPRPERNAGGSGSNGQGKEDVRELAAHFVEFKEMLLGLRNEMREMRNEIDQLKKELKREAKQST